MLNVIAYNGDCWSAPASTIEGLWAALGAGADNFCLDVFLTADQELVCSPASNLNATCGIDKEIHDTTLSEIQKLDAGATWRSTELNDLAQPTGRVGEDLPWSSAYGRKIKLASLADTLRILGRRSGLYIRLLPEILESNTQNTAQAVANQLSDIGLSTRTPIIASAQICKHLRSEGYQGLLIADLTELDQLSPSSIRSLEIIEQCNGLLAWAEQIASLDSTEDLRALTGNNDIPWTVITQSPFSPTPEVVQGLIDLSDIIEGIIVRGVLPTVEQLYPPYTVMEDTFLDGTNINRNLWTAGYSHTNKDTRIFQEQGLQIEIAQGGSYSGAAAVTCDSYHGDFDVQVDFNVAHPHQGTTFEMAAIGIDPGYFNIDNSRLSGKKVNLTFDVHGAPPYASSERDEDDGFRLGWNNSFNLTKVGQVTKEPDGSVDVDNWASSSVNMYNKYRRDVGNGEASSPSGTLRLVRSGPYFTSYYQDKYNPGTWVCSGTALVPNLPEDVFIRLAAKHWKKRNPEPPKNHITFTNFKIRQY